MGLIVNPGTMIAYKGFQWRAMLPEKINDGTPQEGMIQVWEAHPMLQVIYFQRLATWNVPGDPRGFRAREACMDAAIQTLASLRHNSLYIVQSTDNIEHILHSLHGEYMNVQNPKRPKPAPVFTVYQGGKQPEASPANDRPAATCPAPDAGQDAGEDGPSAA